MASEKARIQTKRVMTTRRTATKATKTTKIKVMEKTKYVKEVNGNERGSLS